MVTSQNKSISFKTTIQLVSFPDPPKRKGGSGEYSTSHYGLAVDNTVVCTYSDALIECQVGLLIMKPHLHHVYYMATKLVV